MVDAVRPGKFYGSNLPRPRLYADIKFSSDRVDPPVSVSDPLLSWANEAHWSMGGLSFQRLRLQGSIEGSVKKLRSRNISSDKKKSKIRLNAEKPPLDVEKIRNIEQEEFVESKSESGDESDHDAMPEAERKMERNLADEFEQVADAPSDLSGYQTRSKRSAYEKSFGKSSRSREKPVKRSRYANISVKKAQVNVGSVRRTSRKIA